MTNSWMNHLLDEMRLKCAGDPFMLQGLERMVSTVSTIDHYVFRSEQMERMSERILDATSNDELCDHLRELTYEAGYRFATLVIIEYGRRAPRGPRMLATCDDQWIEDFINRKRLYSDPMIERAHKSSDSVFLEEQCCSEEIHLNAALRARESSSINASAVLSIIMPDGAKCLACFYDPFEDSATRERRHHKISDVTQVCRELLFAFFDVNSIEHSVDDLSDREMTFLAMLAYLPDPSQAMSVLPEYGSNSSLQRGLMKKLGVETLFQAAAIAAKLNLIDYTHPGRHDIVKLKRKMLGCELLQ